MRSISIGSRLVVHSGPRGSQYQGAIPRLASIGDLNYVSNVSVKEQVLQAIQRLPDDINYRDVTDEIAFLAAIGEAERDIETGRVVGNEEMKARIAEWTGS